MLRDTLYITLSFHPNSVFSLSVRFYRRDTFFHGIAWHWYTQLWNSSVEKLSRERSGTNQRGRRWCYDRRGSQDEKKDQERGVSTLPHCLYWCLSFLFVQNVSRVQLLSAPMASEAISLLVLAFPFSDDTSLWGSSFHGPLNLCALSLETRNSIPDSISSPDQHSRHTIDPRVNVFSVLERTRKVII